MADTYNIKDPLVVIGSGPSLEFVDFNILQDFDTFSINDACYSYEKMNWYPKYYGAFDEDWVDSNKKQIKKIIDSPISNLFFFNDTNINKKDNVTLIEKQFHHDIKTSLELWVPWHETIETAIDVIKSENDITTLAAKNIIMRLIGNHDLPPSILASGIIKTMRGEKLSPEDYNKPTPKEFQEKCKRKMPQSLQEFYRYDGTPSTHIAVEIGVLLGYKKIILLGVDCSYHIDNKKNRFWDLDNQKFIDDVNLASKRIGEEGYDIEKAIEHQNNNHFKEWDILNEWLIEKNIDVVNCSAYTELDVFPQGMLEMELGIEELEPL